MKAISNITTKKWVWLAVAFVLIVNAAIMGKVFFNRSEVIAKLQLSERELQLPYNYGFTKEDSSKRVSLDWATPALEATSADFDNWRWYHDRRLQLSETHFASFDFPDCEKSQHLRYKQDAWVLLEFNGQSYTDYVARAEQYHTLINSLSPTGDTEMSEKELTAKRKSAGEILAAAKNSRSRLFVIDAAAEQALLEIGLRERPAIDGATRLIVPAEVQAGYYRCDKSEQRTTEISVNNLAVESLYIPRDFAKDLPFDNNGKSKTHFNVEIYYGRLHEPWIHSLDLCTQDCS